MINIKLLDNFYRNLEIVDKRDAQKQDAITVIFNLG